MVDVAATKFPATDILQNSSISGFQFDNGDSYRVFYQGKNGALHAMDTNNGNSGNNWVGGDKKIVLAPGVAVPGTPLASVYYLDEDGLNSRTYYLGLNYQIRRVGVTPGGITDELVGSGFHAARYSTLGAIAWIENGKPQIRVYYQSADDKIKEISWNGSDYVISNTLPITPLKGTALAFVKPRFNAHVVSIRGYYQHSDNTIREICWDSSEWKDGTNFNVNKKGPNRANMSACVPVDYRGMSVYWQYQHNTVCAGRYRDQLGWLSADEVPNLTTAPNGKFLACSWIPKGSKHLNVRIIFLAPNGRWADRRLEDDSASGASGGEEAPDRVPADF